MTSGCGTKQDVAEDAAVTRSDIGELMAALRLARIRRETYLDAFDKASRDLAEADAEIIGLTERVLSEVDWIARAMKEAA